MDDTFLFIFWGFNYLFFKKILFKKIKKIFYFFLFYFFYFFTYSLFRISLSLIRKGTDYPGKEIARLVQNKWDKNFINEINIVIGDEWYAGNLSYHLYSRPKWILNIELSKLLKSVLMRELFIQEILKF